MEYAAEEYGHVRLPLQQREDSLLEPIAQKPLVRAPQRVRHEHHPERLFGHAVYYPVDCMEAHSSSKTHDHRVKVGIMRRRHVRERIYRLATPSGKGKPVSRDVRTERVLLDVFHRIKANLGDRYAPLAEERAAQVYTGAVRRPSAPSSARPSFRCCGRGSSGRYRPRTCPRNAP